MLTARHPVVVSAGSGAPVPGISGRRAAGPWAGHEAASATPVLAGLVVIGGGVAGSGTATAVAAFGSSAMVPARDGVQRACGQRIEAGEVLVAVGRTPPGGRWRPAGWVGPVRGDR